MNDSELQDEACTIIGRLLVIESAQAAGLLVAATVAADSRRVLLVASQQPREDSTLACIVVRFRVGGDGDVEQTRGVPSVGAAERLAIVDWDDYEGSDDGTVHLFFGTGEGRNEYRLTPASRATPARWASLFQVTTEVTGG